MTPDHLGPGETATGQVAVTLTVVCSDEEGVAKATERLSAMMAGLVLDGFGVNLNAGHVVNVQRNLDTPDPG